LVTVSPNFIQYQNPYGYCYSKDDFFIFCKSTFNNGVTPRIQCMSNPDNVYINSNTDLNNFDLNKVRKLYITDLYPNTTNQSYIKLNSDLQCTNKILTDGIQAFSASNLITLHNDITMVNKLLNFGNLNNIFCSIINANTNNNNEIKFNNTCNFQNNLITNYNLSN